MTPEKIIKFCKVLSITDLDILIEELQYIRNEKYNYTYKEVFTSNFFTCIKYLITLLMSLFNLKYE